MKLKLLSIPALALASGGAAFGELDGVYTNFVRQKQLPSNVQWDVSVLSSGTQLSALSLDNGGARFELWTIKSNPLVNYLLDSRYVGAFVPMAEVNIQTEDPYPQARTRADRPFNVRVDVSGLRTEPNAPAESKSVKLTRHVQSYGVDGVGLNLNTSQATLKSQATITNSANYGLSYALTGIPALPPGDDIGNIRGEERFTVYSLTSSSTPPLSIASKTVKIWPTAKVSLSGLPSVGPIKLNPPPLTLTLTDLYPDSTTYVQIYKGTQVLGTVGKVIPGSSVNCYESVPQNRTLTLSGWARDVDTDGAWTIEVITQTPFGKERLPMTVYLTPPPTVPVGPITSYTPPEFKVSSNINGMITTIEK
jgi:hypothetical protein